MPSSALDIDVVGEIWRHDVILPNGVKLREYVDCELD